MVNDKYFFPQIIEAEMFAYETRVPAVYISTGEVICPLPSSSDVTDNATWDSVIAMSYQLSLSNDNSQFGTPATVVIYDGTCVNCSVGVDLCTLKVR